MPKLITAHHPEQVAQQAREYVKTYILFPSGGVGLFCLIGAIGGLGYQWAATDSYTWTTFFSSSILMVLGLVFGLAQTKYHQFLLRRFPEVLAARMRFGPGRSKGRAKKDASMPAIDHQGRQLIPVAYLAGIAILVGSGVTATFYGQLHAIPAVLMPWAGFYWGKLFFWRRVIQ